MEFSILAVGKYGEIELCVDYDQNNRIYMNIDAPNIFLYFIAEIQEEERFLKVIISFLKNDGNVVWKDATEMKLGKFGNLVVSLIKTEGKAVIHMSSGNSAIRYDLNQEDFLKACELALKDLC